ncbi:GNAT family N-acetyltransferase [Pseudomonas sessilinigenes]|uniref:GNAT family N-acetyltransferase n=1 Tax=Pseudomonas sessilinigenes TaxID=658629 RepID=A0ABX8MFV8_9PSED|nr:GNAT family N-acetyltransferase [Pseudomonas sessilinigenes]AZC24957.1 Acetyltransferase, GNAT family [Pseudomonas sessilinigenes]QXH37998.1 GNAT family N-acetyltransferase [Pseudomonas sessilinigenes]
MPNVHISLLSEASRPLLNKFYRQHRSTMRASGEGQLWVLRDEEIVAGMSLTPVEQGHWLTGLFVAPLSRGQGLARRLIEQALQETPGPVWLFCHPDLEGFYQCLGFTRDPRLPPPLAERLARYQRSKPLLAMASRDCRA